MPSSSSSAAGTVSSRACECGAQRTSTRCCSSPGSGCCSCGSPSTPQGDPNWIEAWAELYSLHRTKAGDYGTADDSLANYVLTSEAVGEPDEFTPALRCQEKIVRNLNLIRDGRADDADWMDLAALALGAEALRRRRRS